MNRKLAITLLGGIILAILLFLYQKPAIQTQVKEPEASISIVTSFYPLAYFSEQVAQEYADISLLTETGSDPHHFTLSPSQRIQAEEADIFLYNGAGLDPWAETLAKDLKAMGIITIEMAESLPEAFLHEAEEHEDEHGHEEDEHEHGAIDPHFWLNPEIAQEMTRIIKEALVQLDPENAEAYTSQALLLTDRLTSLDKGFKESLESCEQDTIVVAHDAYGYLAERYGFTTLAIAGLSPDAQPSAKTLAELETLAKQDGIKHVFFETLANPKISEVFADDIGATTLVLHPLEGLTLVQATANLDYFSLMQENQENLAIALQCNQ